MLSRHVQVIRAHAFTDGERALDTLLRRDPRRAHHKQRTIYQQLPHCGIGNGAAASSFMSVLIKTFAPFVISCGRENSFGA